MKLVFFLKYTHFVNLIEHIIILFPPKNLPLCYEHPPPSPSIGSFWAKKTDLDAFFWHI